MAYCEERACRDKERHRDRKTARKRLKSLVRARKARFMDMNVYVCPHCTAWHVGHRDRYKHREWEWRKDYVDQAG